MRSRASSSGDTSSDRYRYLHAVPKHMRNLDKNGNKREIKIVRTGRMLGNCHKEVKIIENGITIYHAIQ